MKFAFPEYNNSLYSLHYAILRYFGIKTQTNFELKKKKGKLLLILIDGLGFDTAKNFFKNIIQLSSTFPSSTPTALSTLFLGLLPSEHKIFIKSSIKSLGGAILTFPGFSSYPSGSKINNLDINEIFPYESIFQKLAKKKIKSAALIRKGIAESQFTKLLYKGSNIIPTHTIFDSIMQLHNCKDIDFCVLYIPEVDEFQHEYGKKNEAIKLLINTLMNNLEKLNSFDIIITADHGHIQIDKVTVINKLLRLNIQKVFGDYRALMINGEIESKKLIKYFSDKNYFIFDKNEGYKLLGEKGSIEELPDWIIVPKSKEVFVMNNEEKDNFDLKTFHGGLSEQEMKIPLIIL